MRGASIGVMVMLWGQISEMMHQVWTGHYKQCQEQQYRTERTETTTSPAPLKRA